MTTYFDTDYQETGAGDLMNYISREGDTPVRGRDGRPMSDAEKDRFIARSERHEFERHMIIAPENGNQLSNEELGRETRRTMNDFTEGRPSATYAYTVHDDTEHKHAHVAVTGEKTDLYMDREDIEQVRENANERMVENERYRHRQQEQEQQREQERKQALEAERKRRKRERTNEHNRGMGL